MKPKIGLSFDDLCEIKSQIKKECKFNHAVNCGDFEEAFAKTVNKVMEKIQKRLTDEAL